MSIEEMIVWLQQIKVKYIRGGDEAFDEKREEAIELAVELAKKRMPKEPVFETFGMITKIFGCPSCHKIMHERQRFCDDCGQAVKWDD